MANNKKIEKKIKFKASKNFNVFVSDKGFLSESQFKGLKKGEAVCLDGVPEKQMKYFASFLFCIISQFS